MRYSPPKKSSASHRNKSSSYQKRTNIVDSVSIGALSHKETVRFTIENFRLRGEKPGQGILSPVVTAHGYEWRIRIFPRGDSRKSPSGHVSCYLQRHQWRDVTAALTFRCKNTRIQCPLFRFPPVWFKWEFGCNLLMRRDVEKCLEPDGSLIVEIDIQVPQRPTNTKKDFSNKTLEITFP